MGFLTGYCYIGDHITRKGLKHNSDCRIFGEKDENPKHLISNSMAIAIVRVPSEEYSQSQLLQFIITITLDEEL